MKYRYIFVLSNKINSLSMKRFFYFCVITAFAVNVLSCSKNEEYPIPSSVGTRTSESLEAQRAANIILRKFVKLDEHERYYLDISLEDALKLGVPAEFYDKGIQDIEDTNRSIQWYRENDPEADIHISDPTERTSTPTPYAFISGTLSTSSQEEARAEFWAPREMLGVNFLCRAHVALCCTYICKTYSFGNWRTKVHFGSFYENTPISVPLVASDVYASVCFSTSDSNGGIATYSGY